MNKIMNGIVKHLTGAVIAILLIFAGGLPSLQTASAQGTVNVSVTGIPPVLPSPLLSDLVTGYESGRYTMQVIYSSPNQIPADFRLRVTLNHNGSPVLETLSEPVRLTPGAYFYNRFTDMPEIFFTESLSTLITRLPSNFRDALSRGVLPEGIYQMGFELVPVQAGSGIVSIPGNSFFTVQYAQPPVLFAPSPNSVVAQPNPIFSWAPVAAPPSLQVTYEILIAEIIGRQTPLQAIEGTRYPAVQAEITDQTIFVMTPEYLPLEHGKTYAWQVTARDAFGTFPFVNGGRSEIQVFTYSEPGGTGEDLEFLAEIIVQPGFARLHNLQNTTHYEDAVAYRLSGPATLELNFLSESVNIPVQLVDLTVQKTGLENPVLMGGAFFSNDALFLKTSLSLNQFLNPEQLRWGFGVGFSMAAGMTLPNGQEIGFSGTLGFGASEIFGEIKSTERPVLGVGALGHEIRINEISLLYPGEFMSIEAEANLFNGDITCPLESTMMTTNGISAIVDCSGEQRFGIGVEGAGSLAGMSVHINGGGGLIEIDWSGGINQLELSLSAGLGIDVLDTFNFRVNGFIDAGIDAVLFRSIGPSFSAGLGMNLGFGEINLHQIEERVFSWLPETGWDIELSALGNLSLPFNLAETPQFDAGLRLPVIDDIVITKDGILLSEIDLSGFDLESSPAFELAGFTARALRFTMRETLFRWNEITRVENIPGRGKPDLAGPWDFDFEGTLSFDPGKIALTDLLLPSCLSGATIALTNGQFRNGTFSASIDAALDSGEPCRILLTPDFGETPGVALEISTIGGDVTGSMMNSMFDTRVNLRTDASITKTPFVSCQGGQSVATGQLLLGPNGLPDGTLQVTGSGCSVDLGPFKGNLTEGSLSLGFDGGVQAELATGISVRFQNWDGNMRTANGFMRADLTAPAITELDMTLQGPVGFGIPQEDPVFRFELSEVRLTPEELIIQGEQVLKAGSASLGALFENVRMRYTQPGLSFGRIVIDDSFNLILNTTGSSVPVLQVASANYVPDDLEGAFMTLNGPVAIDSTGISLSGSAVAGMKFNQIDLPELMVDFNDDFSLGTNPINVISGRADFIFDGSRIAWYDAMGLHPDLSFFNLIDPERILLPVESVAYITLKENGENLLELEPLGDGRLAVRNIPGKTPQLVVPALQRNLAQPPTFNIVLEDVVVDPLSMSPVSGTITALVPGDGGMDLNPNGIPLVLRQIVFGDIDQGGFPVRALWLLGDIVLYNTPIRTTEPASLMVLGDGTIEGHLSLEGFDSGFNISENGMVNFRLETLNGFMRVPGSLLAMPQFDLTTAGRFQVVYGDEPAISAAANLRIQPGNITVNSIADGEGSGTGSIGIGGFFLRIDKLNSLSLSWQPASGFNFYAGMNMSFGFRGDDFDFTVPVTGVGLSNQGFEIPEQERHQHSLPALNLPAFELQGIRLKPIAARIPAVNITWNNIGDAQIVEFLPRFDFELGFPGFTETVPQLASAAITLADAGLTDGIISGSLIPFTFGGNGVEVPLAPPSGNPPVFRLQSIGGGLERLDSPEGPAQRLNILMSGQLANLPSLSNDETGQTNGQTGSGQSSPGQTGSGETGSGSSCSDPEITVRLTSARGFEGTVESLVPCGSLGLGMVDLVFNQGSAVFSFSENTQSILFNGQVTAFLPSPQAGGVRPGVTGTLGVDLMTGEIQNGAIEIAEPFLWAVPGPESGIFQLLVNQARLDGSGLALQGQAGIDLGGPTLGVTLNNFLYSFRERRFVSGNAQIEGGFGLEIEFTGDPRARFIDPASPFTAANALRLVSQSTVALDHEGLKLAGSSTASLRFGEHDFPEITVEYVPGTDGPFTLRPNPQILPPVQVVRGRADLKTGNTRIAWYDSDGVHFDNVLAALPIPDRIGLPTEDIAYLQLRNDAGELVVETENISGGYTLRTKSGETVDLVLAGFDSQNPPRVALGFEVTVNDLFVPTSGALIADLSSNPLNMEPYTGIPIELKSIAYDVDAQSGTYRLMANAGLKLPGELSSIALTIEELLFNNGGFQQAAFSAGNYSQNYDPDVTPLVSVPFGQGGTEMFKVNGVRLEFGQQNSAQLSGVLSSGFLKDEGAEDPYPVFWHGSWEQAAGPAGGNWTIALGLAEGQEIPVSKARVGVESAAATLNAQGFNIELNGYISVPDVMGAEFRMSFEELRVGTSGLSLGKAEITADQDIELFEGILEGRITRLTLEISNRVLYASGDGEMTFLEHPMSFSNLRVGTDGSFSIDQADLLAGDARIDIVEDFVWIDSLALGIANNRISLAGGGAVRVPEPLNATSSIYMGIRYGAGGGLEIDGPNIALILGEPGSDYSIGSGPAEVDIGDLATLALTGLALDLDLYDLANTRFYSTAIVFMENDNAKKIMFGDSGQIRDEPGILIGRDILNWNVKSHGSNLFSFDAGFFRLQVDGVKTFDPGVFGLSIDGEMGIVIGGDDTFFQGRTGFLDMRIAMPADPLNDPNPIVKWPDFNGISVTIMDIIALELGVFDFGIASTASGIPFTVEEGSDPDNITETTIMVKEYLRFYNPLEGASAVSISLTDAFSGGVEEILIYRDVNDVFLLHIKNADLALSSVGNLNINFRLLIGPGQFSLLAAGGGNITGLGGLAAAGKFGIDVTSGFPMLSFGVFFAIKSESAIPLIYQAPPAIGLAGIGGGFFFRPEAVDMDAVYSAVSAMDPALGFMLEQRGLPPADANFAAMVYANFIMIGQGPVNTYAGSLFLELTDNYINLTAAGSLVMQGANLTAGMYATLNWSNLSLSGGIAAKIGYDPIIGGVGNLGFTMAINVPQQRIDWVVSGGLEANVVGIPANGSLVISPDGLYADLNVNANYSFVIVTLDGNFTIKTWVIPNYNNPLNSEIGAFAQVDIKAALPGASVSALANGTFILKNQKHSLYTLAEADVDVMFVGSAKIWVFAEFRDGKMVDAGVLNEVDGKFAELLDEAGKMADEMNAKSEQAKNNVANATQYYSTSLSNEILAAAGANYLKLQQSAAGRIVGMVVDAVVMQYETLLFTPYDNNSVPAALRNVNTNIKNSSDMPDKGHVDDAGTAMNTALNNANSSGPQVIQLINQTRAEALEWLEQTDLNLGVIQNPASSTPGNYQSSYDGFTIAGSTPFSVNQQVSSQLAETLSEAYDTDILFSDKEPGYIEAIETALNNLQKLDIILNGAGSIPGVIEQGSRYSLARQAVGQYYARLASYFHEQYRWADGKHQMLINDQSNIENAILQSVQAMNGMSNTVAESRCEQARNVFGIYNWCYTNYALGQLVAEKRREAVMALSGATTAQTNQSVQELSQVMTNLRNSGNLTEFRTRFRETATEYWFQSMNLGYDLYKNEARSQHQSINQQRMEKLNPLNVSHRDFTRSLDSLFIIKARMTENIYAMIDAYLEARNNAGLAMNTTQVVAMESKRQQLANDLVPPVITSLTVNERLLRESKPRPTGSGSQYRDRFVNRANITWDASHPSGTPEYGIGVIPGHHNSIHSSNIYSAGSNKYYFHWSNKGYSELPSNVMYFTLSSEPITTLDFTATVRARGKAGYTASRTTQFTATIEGSSGWTLSSQPKQSSTYLSTVSSTPTTPSATLNGGIWDGKMTIPKVYWWHDAGRLDLSLTSSDSETGINRFEMAIGTFTNNKNLMPWTTVTGTRNTNGNSVTIDAVVRQLNLNVGGYGNVVYLRAINGAGNISAERTIRVRVDETPPALVNIPAQVRVREIDDDDPGTGSLKTTNPKTHTIHLPEFSDPESGIKHLEYIVSAEKRIPVEAFESGQATITNLKSISVPTTYRDSSYVYVRALNLAGLYSGYVVIPYKTYDLTAPTTPLLTFEPVINGLRIIFGKESDDQETGIRGYIYALGTSPGADDIKRWKPGNELDFSPADLIKNKAGNFYLIPNESLPMDREFHITLRAVNGQNRKSARVIPESLILSQKPPGFSEITMESGRHGVGVSGLVYDSTTGVQHIDYRVRDKITGEILLQGMLYDARPATGVKIGSVFTIPGADWRHSVSVLLTARNAAGLTRTYNQDVILNASALDPVPAPGDVTVTTDLRTSVSWSASATPYLRRYEVIREEDGVQTVVAEVEAGTHSITIPTYFSKSTYRYGVRAVTISEHKSTVAFPRVILSRLQPIR